MALQINVQKVRQNSPTDAIMPPHPWHTSNDKFSSCRKVLKNGSTSGRLIKKAKDMQYRPKTTTMGHGVLPRNRPCFRIQTRQLHHNYDREAPSPEMQNLPERKTSSRNHQRDLHAHPPFHTKRDYNATRPHPIDKDSHKKVAPTRRT